MQSNFLEIIIPILLLLPLLLALWRIGQWRVKKYLSPISGTIEVWKKYNGEKMLTINNYLQGVSIEQESIKKSYWFCIAKLTITYCQDKTNPRLLMLGLGSNTISGLIGKLQPKIHQIIVEIDPQIIKACQEYFNLDQLPNYQLIQADAYKLLNKKGGLKTKFDVIVVDIYTGHPPFISLKSNQVNFIKKLLPYLKKNGLVIFNRPGHTTNARADSQKLKNNLQTLFKKTELLDIADPRGLRNNIITGHQKGI